MRYKPKPIATDHIHLDEEILALTEKLAKNAHEVWAAKRFAEGWTRGPRNDKNKTNPTLVPYHKLSETEKEYDRALTLETLKVILALGYRIEKP